jgi:hypothetical protein
MKRLFKTIALAAIASLALTGCFKHDPIDRHGGYEPGGNGRDEVEKLVVNERSDWHVSYVAREDWVNDDGSVDQVEHFKFKYTGKGYYIVRLVRPEDFEGVYENDAAAFFTYEAESLVEDAKKDNVNFWDYTDEVFNSRISDIFFNRLRSGSWIAFMIELDGKGNVTGDFAEADFTIQEEEATASFSKWLGTWRASNGLVGYDLTISSLDNNFLYRIDGWECGPAAACQMDLEYLEGEFYAPNGFLYIVSQYLGSYDDENLGTVDELFLGNIFDSGGLTLIEDEGLDLAVMVPQGDDLAELQALEVTLSTDNGDYTTPFHSMQYYMWAHDDGSWHPYNGSVAQLPLAMTRLPGTKAADAAPAKERAATKASIHHAQPKAGQTARKSVAKKSVRLK